ncbi:hypothetical protein A2771_00430 [Candidatus Woesebacteria bacterium RIFCSPHIGHO2_01_FULL_38_26b]|uniref:Uncharacterized protein n=1 Tax=Candidatus Woesebacteria bacterium RIFCSPHIGHO2_01_FULL_38_26b TaxID=1802491 RepID=A0A1F7Y2T9_9BACT|nr:MAG: hypothetical protein A2771_00430 [Candidatus Woesebacteria bacterium RIFCSPHIGHO2_01_FULL_38_26b]
MDERKTNSYIVDRGGIRGVDGKLINSEFVHLPKTNKSDAESVLTQIPPAADSMTVDQALIHLVDLQQNPAKAE